MALNANRRARFLVALCAACVFLMGSSQPAKGDKADESSKEKQALADSGPKAGATIHPFFVRAVTGPHRNLSLIHI